MKIINGSFTILLLELANKNEVIANSIADSILIENNDQWNGLHMIVKIAPNALPKLVELANKNAKVSVNLLSALDRPNKNGNSPRMMMTNNPDLRPILSTLELTQLRKNTSNDTVFDMKKRESIRKKPLTLKSRGLTRKH